MSKNRGNFGKWWGDFSDLTEGERPFEPFEVKIVDEIVPEINAITHPAPHHADESFSTAMLSYFRPVVVYRTREQVEMKQAVDLNRKAGGSGVIIYDVGGDFDADKLIFDHHQRGYREARADGTRYSSDGLIWREFGQELLKMVDCPPEYLMDAWECVDETLFRGVDGLDNGQFDDDGFMSVGAMLALFNPLWDEECPDDETFLEMVGLAQKILKRLLENVVSAMRGRKVVERLIDEAGDKPYIIMEKPITGWREAVLKSNRPNAQKIMFGIYQGAGGRWNVRTVPPSLDEMLGKRQAFPEEWAGLRGADLVKASGVKSANFCHANRFLAVADELDDAVKMAESAIEN